MRFTIGKKIGLGFGVVVFLLLTIFSLILFILRDADSTLEASIQSNELFNEVGQPTVDELNDLFQNLKTCETGFLDWVNRQSRTDDVEKVRLLDLMNTQVPKNLNRLNELVLRWDTLRNEEHRTYYDLRMRIVKLFETADENIIQTLHSFGSYSDPTFRFIAEDAHEFEVKPEMGLILEELTQLIHQKNEDAAKQKEETNGSFKKTQKNFSWFINAMGISAIVLLIGVLIIATFTTTSITKPVKRLKGILVDLGRGVFPDKAITPSNDEIGEMSVAMNQLVNGLKQTTNFANEVGKSNFNYDYQPLSEEDILGQALLKMRDELAESERILEEKVIERTKEVVRQKEEIERQSLKLEELYKDVTDSIRYAKRLQDSILPPESFIKKLLPQSFVLFKPKDIVSGDFYWFQESNGKVLFAAVDCTGHGVPGAFMSLIGANALNQIVKEGGENNPSVILNELNRLSSEALNKGEDSVSVRDGMDLALCAVDIKNGKLEYAGANNPLYIIRGDELIQTKADKFAIASFEDGVKQYTTHEFELQKGDVIYVFSDGYADQFGGVKGKKFMYKQFRDLLRVIKDLPLEEQKIYT